MSEPNEIDEVDERWYDAVDLLWEVEREISNEELENFDWERDDDRE